MKEKFRTILTTTVISVSVLGVVYCAQADWANPTLPPTNGNTEKPIHVGGEAQVKGGGLTIAGRLILPLGAGTTPTASVSDPKVLITTNPTTGAAEWKSLSELGVGGGGGSGGGELPVGGPFLGRTLVFNRTSSGSFSGSLEPGAYIVEFKGGGGGGGGASWNSSNPESGGGGGEGETQYYRFTIPVTTAFSGTVGGKGLGAKKGSGNSGDNVGGDGGTSYFTLGSERTLLAAGGNGGCYLYNEGSLQTTYCSRGGGSTIQMSSDRFSRPGVNGGLPVKHEASEDTVTGGNGGGYGGGLGGSVRMGKDGTNGGTKPVDGMAYSGGGGGGAANDRYPAADGGCGYILIWKM